MKNTKKKKMALYLSIFLTVIIFLNFFIPHSLNINKQTFFVTRYIKGKGKVFEKVGPKEKSWVPLNKVSLHFVHAVLVAEDARFYTHNGVDLQEIWKSLYTNLEQKRFARGASTITQQVVKMLYLSRNKTLTRKIREMLGAFFLELTCSKDEILTWYLNLIELGDGVYGVENGARHYFSTNSELLTISQSIHLALVLPSPNRWSKGLRKKKLTKFGRRRFALILEKMLASNYITEPQFRTALATGNFDSPVH